MGRRKISIKQIDDTKLRNITFNKRKNGLIKKAAELSMLCNVNMLLIFEDGYGNLIQFSRDKIKNIASFFKDCKYNNVIEVSSKDYPDFSAVAQFRKLRDRSDASLVVKKHGTRTRKIAGEEPEEDNCPDFELEETSTDDNTSKDDSSSSQPTPKSMIFTPTANTLADKLMNQSAQNKGKNKLGLKLRIPEEKNSMVQETAKNNEIAQPVAKVVFDDSENNYEKPALSPGQFQPGLYPDNSPYGLFENARLSGNTLPSGDSLARLQGFSYAFPQGGNLNMNLQANNLGDYEEKLDSAKMNAFLNCGQINDQQCFNFEDRNGQEEIIRMNNQFNLSSVEIPILRNGMSAETQPNNFYDMNYGNFMNDAGDFRNFMVAPMKKMKQV
jgi:hypothetical protein